MAVFSLHVSASPYAGQGHLSALAFARAAINAGHTVKQVFFSADAVMVAHKYAESANGEPDAKTLWLTLSQQSPIEFLLCSSACQKRGLLDKTTAGNFKAETNIADAFAIAGLGCLVEAALTTDQQIHFPG